MAPPAPLSVAVPGCGCQGALPQPPEQSPCTGTGHSRRDATTQVSLSLWLRLLYRLLSDFPRGLIKYSCAFRTAAFPLRTVANCAVL